MRDPVTASYHIKRSIESIVRGGFFGVGIGRGSSKFGLPVSHTDSIFAVIVEELGVVGAIALIAMYAGIVAMAVLGLGLYFAVDWLERKLCPWEFAG